MDNESCSGRVSFSYIEHRLRLTKPNSEPYWTLFDTDEFQKAFPPPCAAKHLVKLICKYVDYVAHVVLKVDSLLQDTID